MLMKALANEEEVAITQGAHYTTILTTPMPPANRWRWSQS